MRFAQRSSEFHETTSQQVEPYEAPTVGELWEKIDNVIMRYAVKIVTLTAYSDTFGHHALVVFEEE